MRLCSSLLTALLFLISSKTLISYYKFKKICFEHDPWSRLLNWEEIHYIITASYLNVSNEVLLVYDQPVKLVFQSCYSFDYASKAMERKKKC